MTPFTSEGDISDVCRRFGLRGEDVAAWRSSGRPPEDFEEWLTDRVARRPEGARAREVYGAEDVHDFARSAILDALSLSADDRLLDIGCGGGLLLADALAAGAAVTGIDHSPDMVALARERAPHADVVLGPAERLPFADGAFTAVSLSVVFGLLEDPVAALQQSHRVLDAGAGRLALYTTAAELRGTPAAPEPLAAHAHFYADDELVALAGEARFTAIAVVNDDGGQILTARA